MKVLNQQEVGELEKYFNGYDISRHNYQKIYNRLLDHAKLNSKPTYSNGEELYIDDFINEYIDNFWELV